MIFVHEIKLSENNEFSRKFNEVSDLWTKSQDRSLTPSERAGYEDAFWSAKYCLEQGIG
jgi:hypothetical protein